MSPVVTLGESSYTGRPVFYPHPFTIPQVVSNRKLNSFLPHPMDYKKQMVVYWRCCVSVESKAASQRSAHSLDVSIIEIPLQYCSLCGLIKVLKKDTLYPSLISLPPLI